MKWIERLTTMPLKVWYPASWPWRPKSGDVGWDIETPKQTLLPSHCFTVIKTDIHLKMPDIVWGMIAVRSSWSDKVFVNGGIIDPSYTGEIKLVVYNITDRPILVQTSERIAQIIFIPRTYLELQPTWRLPHTYRRNNGFGSTGK